MNIKVPKNITSPTVIVIGQGTMDASKNDLYARRMDNLERKLDRQYESFYKKQERKNNTDYSALLKTFSSKIGSLEKSIKKLAEDDDDDSNEELLSSFKKLVGRIEKNKKSVNNSSPNYRLFMNRIGKLEEAIRDLPTQRVSINTSGLSKSFNNLYERLEKAIKDSRPRMIPSPS